MPALYRQQVEVIVRKEETQAVDGGDSTKVTTQATEDKAQDGQGGYFGGTSAKERMLRVNLLKLGGVARTAHNAYINYIQHQQGLRNGDQALADSVDRQFEVFQDVTSTACNVGIGIAYGISGGAPGIIIGATAGVTSSAISLISKYSNRQLEFDYKMFKQNNGTEYQRARASINMTNGRLR